MKLLVYLLVLCVAVIAQRRASPFARGVFVEGHVSKRHNNPSSMGGIPFHVPNHYRVVKRMPYKVIRIPIYENHPHFSKVQYATQKPNWPHPMEIPVPRPEAPFKQIDLVAADIQPQADPKNRIIFPSGLSQYLEKPYNYGHRPSIDSAPINVYAPQQHQHHPSDEKQYQKGSSKLKSQSIIYNYSKQHYPQTPVNHMPEHTYNTQENLHRYVSDLKQINQQLPSQDHFVPMNQNNNNQNQFGNNYKRPDASASYVSEVPKSHRSNLFKNQYKTQSSKDAQTFRPSIADITQLQYNNNQKEFPVKPEKSTPVYNVGTNTQLQYNQNQLGLNYQKPQIQSNYKEEISSPFITKVTNDGTKTQYNQNYLGVNYKQPQVESNYKQESDSPFSNKILNIGTNMEYDNNQNQLGQSYQQSQVEPTHNEQKIARPVATKPSNIETNTYYNYNQNHLGLSYQQPQVESSYKQNIVSSVASKPYNDGTNTNFYYLQKQHGINYQQPQEEPSYKQEIASPILTKASNIGINTQFHYVQNNLEMNYQQPQVTASYKFEEPKSTQYYINEAPYKSENTKVRLHGNNVQIGNNQVGMIFQQPQVTAGYKIEELQEPYNFENQYKNYTKLTVDSGNQKSQQQEYNNQHKVGAIYQASASYKLEEPKSQSFKTVNQYDTVSPQGNIQTKLDGYRNIFTGNYDQPQVSASYKIEEPKAHEPFNSVTVSSGIAGQIYQDRQSNQQQSWKPSITNYKSTQGYNFQLPKSNDHIYYQAPPEYQTQAPIVETYKQSANHEELKSQKSSMIDYNYQSNIQANVDEYGKKHEKNGDSSIISVNLDTNHYVPNVYKQQNTLNEESGHQFNYFREDDGLSKSSNQEVQVINPIRSNVYKTEGAYNSNSMKSDGLEVENKQEFSPIVAKEVENEFQKQKEAGSYLNQGMKGISVWGVSESTAEENWKIVDPPKTNTLSWKRNSYDMNAEDWLKMKEQHDVSSHMLRQGMQQAIMQEQPRTVAVLPEETVPKPTPVFAEERMSYPVHFLVSPQKEQLKGNNINFVPQKSVPTPSAR